MKDTLEELFKLVGQPMLPAIDIWLEKAYKWEAEYMIIFPKAVPEITLLKSAIFMYDGEHEYDNGGHIISACGLSTEQLQERDIQALRHYPITRRSKLDSTFIADKGHYLGHASGGRLDINIFPHRRPLNRGWRGEGQEYRKMEKYVERNYGTFFYHRPVYYNEATVIPHLLEYGILMKDGTWWENTFTNLYIDKK